MSSSIDTADFHDFTWLAPNIVVIWIGYLCVSVGLQEIAGRQPPFRSLLLLEQRKAIINTLELFTSTFCLLGLLATNAGNLVQSAAWDEDMFRSSRGLVHTPLVVLYVFSLTYREVMHWTYRLDRLSFVVVTLLAWNSYLDTENKMGKENIGRFLSVFTLGYACLDQVKAAGLLLHRLKSDRALSMINAAVIFDVIVKVVWAPCLVYLWAVMIEPTSEQQQIAHRTAWAVLFIPLLLVYLTSLYIGWQHLRVAAKRKYHAIVSTGLKSMSRVSSGTELVSAAESATYMNETYHSFAAEGNQVYYSARRSSSFPNVRALFTSATGTPDVPNAGISLPRIGTIHENTMLMCAHCGKELRAQVSTTPAQNARSHSARLLSQRTDIQKPGDTPILKNEQNVERIDSPSLKPNAVPPSTPVFEPSYIVSELEEEKRGIARLNDIVEKYGYTDRTPPGSQPGSAGPTPLTLHPRVRKGPREVVSSASRAAQYAAIEHERAAIPANAPPPTPEEEERHLHDLYMKLPDNILSTTSSSDRRFKECSKNESRRKKHRRTRSGRRHRKTTSSQRSGKPSKSLADIRNLYNIADGAEPVVKTPRDSELPPVAITAINEDGEETTLGALSLEPKQSAAMVRKQIENDLNALPHHDFMFGLTKEAGVLPLEMEGSVTVEDLVQMGNFIEIYMDAHAHTELESYDDTGRSSYDSVPEVTLRERTGSSRSTGSAKAKKPLAIGRWKL